jgi:hypothetical protein
LQNRGQIQLKQKFLGIRLAIENDPVSSFQPDSGQPLKHLELGQLDRRRQFQNLEWPVHTAKVLLTKPKMPTGQTVHRLKQYLCIDKKSAYLNPSLFSQTGAE